jgi:hypothetical protein
MFMLYEEMGNLKLPEDDDVRKSSTEKEASRG